MGTGVRHQVSTNVALPSKVNKDERRSPDKKEKRPQVVNRSNKEGTEWKWPRDHLRRRRSKGKRRSSSRGRRRSSRIRMKKRRRGRLFSVNPVFYCLSSESFYDYKQIKKNQKWTLATLFHFYITFKSGQLKQEHFLSLRQSKKQQQLNTDSIKQFFTRLGALVHAPPVRLQ